MFQCQPFSKQGQRHLRLDLTLAKRIYDKSQEWKLRMKVRDECSKRQGRIAGIRDKIQRWETKNNEIKVKDESQVKDLKMSVKEYWNQSTIISNYCNKTIC